MATGDGRNVLVMLTAEGKAISERAFHDDMVLGNRALAAITETEVDSLETLLRKLA